MWLWGAYLRAWGGAAICAVLWITAALAVAFPEHAFDLDLSAVARGFVTGKERYYVGLLLFVDLIIDRDFWDRGTAAAAMGTTSIPMIARTFLTVTVLYAIIVAFIAINTKRAEASAEWITLLALLCLAYPRFLSYLRPSPRLTRVL